MTRRDFVLQTAAVTAATRAAAAQTQRHPNIILVLADDLGYGDIGCFGNRTVQTPHLDQFAKEGVRFTNCYSAAPNCSPSRSALMTGRTPTRVGVYNWIPMQSPMHLRKEEITIATLLRRNGYATCQTGKWHMNGLFNLAGQPQPNDHGFDHWFSVQNNALPNHRNPYNFVRNGIPVGPQEGYSGQIVAREATHWLKNLRDKNKPFFQYVCFNEPHEPIATDPRFAKLYPSKDPSYTAHHGNITQMDAAFGTLMQTLDELKLRDNTLVFFTSDNGPAITNYHPHGSTGPLRDKKGSVYEGGIRVPGILRWPGHARPATVSDEPICGVDWLPTACEVTGTPAPIDRRIDGASFLPTLEGKPIARNTPLYWHFNHAHTKAKIAMRMGNWKLVATLTGPNLRPTGNITTETMRAIKTAELDRFELYDLSTDIGETTDRAATEPVRLKEMVGVLRAQYDSVRNDCPTWPEFDMAAYNYEGPRIEWPSYNRPSQPKK